MLFIVLVIIFYDFLFKVLHFYPYKFLEVYLECVVMGDNKIELMVKKYEARFPLYSRASIIDEMVKDGVFDKMLKSGEIRQADIENIKKGGSLFLSQNLVKTTTLDFSATKIFGGEFTKKQPKPQDAAKIKPKHHKLTSLIDVDSKGNIITSQFYVEGLRKKYPSDRYKITKVVDKDYPNNSTITVINRKTNKKVLKCQMYESSLGYSRSNTYNIYHYASDGVNTDEFIIVSDYGCKTYIGKIGKYNGKTAIETFLDEDGKIEKTYEWTSQKQKGKEVFDVNKITLYSNNKPYKILKGDYNSTISNYTVEELANILNARKTLSFSEQAKLDSLINTITDKNVYEMLYDYQMRTGNDLLDDLQNIADKDKNKFGETFYIQMFSKNMIKHIRDCMTYKGSLSNDSWLNDHAEVYISNRLVKDLEKGNIDMFKQDLKLAGISLSEQEKPDIELFGNPMVRKVIMNFQHRADSLYRNSESDKGLTKGILYTIAKSNSIQPKEKADIILDIISQLGFIIDNDVRKEINDFTKSDEFMNLMIKYSSEGKYSDDIIADMKLNRNNPDKVLVDFKRLKARNIPSKSGVVVSKPNGKIDVDFKQGRTGDCWLLAGVISLCKKANGKLKLESLLKVDEKTGDVIVTLKGVNKKYKIPYSEIKNSNHLSGGDGDMRALELAFDRYIKELAYNKELTASQVDIQGNTTYYLYQILFGNGKDYGRYKFDMNKEFSNPHKSFCIGASQFDAPYSETIDALINSKGEKVDFVTGHAYAVVKADSKYVYLVNPWDSKETLRITPKQLEKLHVNVGGCNY